MKKSRIIAIFLAAVVALTSLTGCSLFKPTAVSITKKVMKNLETVKSVKGNIRADYEGPASAEGIEFDLALNADLEMETVRDSGVSHVKGSVGTKFPIIGEISLPVESYMQTRDDEAVVYASMDGENWLKLQNDKENEQENGQETEKLPDYKVMLGILQKIVSGDVTICRERAPPYRRIWISPELTRTLYSISTKMRCCLPQPQWTAQLSEIF